MVPHDTLLDCIGRGTAWHIARWNTLVVVPHGILLGCTGRSTVWHIARWKALVVLPYDTLPCVIHWWLYHMTDCQVRDTDRGTIWHIARWRGTSRGTVWHILTHDHVGNEYKISTNSEAMKVFDNIYAFVPIGNARLLTSTWLTTLLGLTWHCCSLCGLLHRFCSILCRSIIKMATILWGYVNLLPPWYFKITLSYFIHVLVLYQGDGFVCRFQIVTNQGSIKLKQVITWRCIQ
jgi:hypothetical protein